MRLPSRSANADGPARSRPRLAAFVAVMAALLAWPGGLEAQDSLEYAVKAAYLVKIAPFVEWPASVFASPSAPLTICVLGQDPFGDLLERAAQGQRDGDHPILVRRIQTPDLACRIVYWGDGDQRAVAAAFAGKPVLTVSDGGPRPGIVNFVTQAGHVRFEIDEDAARASGLDISSKLLSLAVRVKGAGP